MTRLLTDGGFTVRRIRGDVLVPIADEFTRRWARLEEMLIKRLLAATATRAAGWAPWLEILAYRG